MKNKPDEIFTQLTHYESPNSMVHTVHGPLGYSTWCSNEARRISALPGRAACVCREPKGHRIALWVNRVSGKNDGSTSDMPFSDLEELMIGGDR